METAVEFIGREGGAPKGKDWDAFMAHQQEVIGERARDGWELLTAVGVLTVDALNMASKTAGVLLYFRRN
jgi:hypothetical protein